MADHIATVEADIDASGDRVWNALTDPEQIKQYMFGSTVSTDWKPGSPIVWKGEYEGKPYEDKGEIVKVERPRRLELTHFSSASGLADRPENYHTLVYELEDDLRPIRHYYLGDPEAARKAAEAVANQAARKP